MATSDFTFFNSVPNSPAFPQYMMYPPIGGQIMSNNVNPKQSTSVPPSQQRLQSMRSNVGQHYQAVAQSPTTSRPHINTAMLAQSCDHPRGAAFPQHTSHAPAAEQAERQLKRKLSTLLNEEQLELFRSDSGDYTVKCGSRKWKVHEHIVAPRCTYFSAAANFQQDSTEPTIDMSDDDPQAIDTLLTFLYTRNIDNASSKGPFTDNQAQSLANLAVVADKYGETHLLQQVEVELFKFVKSSRMLGYDDHASRVRDACLALIKLHTHGIVSRPLQRLQILMLKFLKNSGQLAVMDTELSQLIETAITEDSRLALLLIKFMAGGQCWPKSSSLELSPVAANPKTSPVHNIPET